MIIQGEPQVIAKASAVTIKSKDIIILQTKANRLGMNLMGQAIISKRLMERFELSGIRSIAICSAGDYVLEPLLKD